MEENYEEQSKVFHLNRAGAANHHARRIRFQRRGQKPAQTPGLGPLGPLRHVQQIWPMLPGSVSGPGRVPGSGSCDFVSGSGPGCIVSGSSPGCVSGSGSCDFVSGSGSGSGSCYHVPDSGSGPCYHVSVETLRRGAGFQKYRFTATSNWGENVTRRLVMVSAFVIEPDALTGAGLGNNLRL
jgi:hypothetical protein